MPTKGIMRTLRNDRGHLVIVYQPVVVLIVATVGTLACGGYACLHAARDQWLMETVGWPLVATLIFAGGGMALGRWWRLDFDHTAQEIRWRCRGITGTRRGSVPINHVVGVVTRARRVSAGGNRRRPPLELVLLLGDGDTFTLTHHAAMGRAAKARLEMIAAIVRDELHLDQPDEQQHLIDAMVSADSLVLAARELCDRTGLSLAACKDLARSARGRRP